ncbi:hypothetical protein [Natrinema thermotolerans]
MSVYRIDADYNAEGPVLTNSDDDFPARIQVATEYSFAELRLSREEFRRVLQLVTETARVGKPEARELEDGRIALEAAPPEADDPWSIELQTGGLEYKVPLSVDELEGLSDLLRTVHPDYEADENEDVEVRA